MNSNIRVAFDVDGTLIHQAGELLDTPRYDIIQILKTYKSLGCTVYVWSGGGVPYAQHWVHKLGLDVPVIGKGEIKVDLCFDDMEVELAHVNVRV